MVPVQDLFIIVEDLVYSSNMNIDIILPYWNKKKDIGPQLARVLKEAGLHRIRTTPEAWVVLTDKGPKYINFTTSLQGHVFSDVVIIPED